MEILSLRTNDDVENIVNRYFDMVYRLAHGYTKDKYNAEDIAQTVFYKLIKSDKIFNGEEHLKAWLLRVTINTSKSVFLTSSYKKNVPIEERKEQGYEQEEKSDLYYAVMDLPKKYFALIHLYYYEGYSTKEICKILSKSKSYVSTNMYRARKILEEKLKGDVDFESI